MNFRPAIRRVALLAVLLAAAASSSRSQAQVLQLRVNFAPQPPQPAKAAEPAESTVKPLRSDARPRLELPSGDFLPGELVDSTEPATLAWQCDGMTRPFVFPLSAVRFVHFPRPPEVGNAPGKYLVELVGGDMLFGEVKELTADDIVIDSPQFGELHIERGEVRTVQRTDASGGLAYAGPNGVADWQQSDGDGAWSDESGALVAQTPGKLSLAGAKLPGKIAIEVELAWRDRADFSLAFAPAADPNASLGAFAKKLLGIRRMQPQAQSATPKPKFAFELAAWDDTLMLVSEGESAADVARVQRSLGANSRVELQIYVDTDERSVAVYSLAGDELAKVELPADAIPKAEGILSLTNRLGDVRLERLVVRTWNGAAPGTMPRDRAAVQLADGQIVSVGSVRLDAEDDELRLTSAGADVADAAGETADEPADEEGSDDKDEADKEARRVPWGDVVRISFPPPKEPRRFAVRASQTDGVRISGKLVEVKGDRLVIERPGVDAPLSLAIADLRSLASLESDWPDGAPAGVVGRLEIAGGVMQGALVEDDEANADESNDDESNDDESAPAGALVWKPLASTTASPLRSDAAGRIIYRERPAALPPIVQPGQAAPAAARPGFLGGVMRAFTNPGPRPIAGDFGDQLLWLKAGDRIPCRVESIDERGVTFTTSLVESKFVPHSAVKAWDAVAGSQPRDLSAKPDAAAAAMYAQRRLGNQPEAADPQRYIRLLTLPRRQRDNPPTHLVESTRGDFLRGRLQSMTKDNVTIEVRMEPKTIPRSAVQRIIWFDNPNKKPAAATADEDAAAVTEDAPDGDVKPTAGLEVQAVRSDGVRLTFRPERFAGTALEGSSDLLGACRVELAMIDELVIGGAIADAASTLAYSDWHLRSAPDPRFMTEDAQGGAAPGSAGLESAMVGEPAPDFSLESSSGGKFELAQSRGHVVVLDFWASWCGPCKAAMPQIRDALGDFDKGSVEWIAVNLQEDAETAAKALERVGVSPRVAFDVDGAAAEKYQVTAIPHTAVVDANGKIAAVFIGSSPNLADDLRAAVEKALEPADETAADAPQH